MRPVIRWLIICIVFIILPSHIHASANTLALDDRIDSLISQHESITAGLAALVVQGDEVIVRKAIGYEDKEEQRKVDEASVFEWGSVSKILIWISVMQLVEEGALALDQDMQHYLPDTFQLPTSFSEPVQLLHLMNHTAGFDDMLTDLMIHDPKSMPTLAEALERADVKQIFVPGEVMAYSNYGSALAAYIVETVSGQDYRTYVKEHIFEPLGMNHTSIDPLQRDHEWVSVQRQHMKAYTTENKPVVPNQYAIPLYPAGSVIGTAEDLGLVMKALMSENGQPLFKKAETIRQLFQPTNYLPNTDIPRNSHGLFSLPSENEVYGHSGNTVAFTSTMYMDRENRLGVLVMINQANESLYTVGIPEIVFGKPASISSSRKLENPATWKGIYQPARMPYHGFSKLYGVLNRTSVTPHAAHGVKTNGIVYTQQRPGIYMAAKEYGLYSRDVYSVHPQYGNILSTSTGDLLQIPTWRHLFEWTLLITGLISGIFSIVMIFLPSIRRSAAHLLPNVLNFVVLGNVAIMFYRAFSLTTYQSLKIHMLVSIAYVAIISSSCVIGLVIRKRFQFNRKQLLLLFFTVLSCLLLCANIVYWELYR